MPRPPVFRTLDSLSRGPQAASSSTGPTRPAHGLQPLPPPARPPGSSSPPTSATTLTTRSRRYEYKHVPGYFHFDVAAPLITPEHALLAKGCFGLLDTSSGCWDRLKAELAELNRAGSLRGESYKLLYLARHQQGHHNVAEAKYTAEVRALFASLHVPQGYATSTGERLRVLVTNEHLHLSRRRPTGDLVGQMGARVDGRDHRLGARCQPDRPRHRIDGLAQGGLAQGCSGRHHPAADALARQSAPADVPDMVRCDTLLASRMGVPLLTLRFAVILSAQHTDLVRRLERASRQGQGRLGRRGRGRRGALLMLARCSDDGQQVFSSRLNRSIEPPCPR